MNLKSLKYFFFLMMAVITLSSCSEDDDNVSEYANWQERNEQAFADTLAYARKMGEATAGTFIRTGRSKTRLRRTKIRMVI